jgi:alpha-mannosidase
MCYDDSDKLYAHNAELGQKIKEDALTILGLSSRRKPGAPIAALNTLPWEPSELIMVPPTKPSGSYPSQVIQPYKFVTAGPGQVGSFSEDIAPNSAATVVEVSKGVFVLQNKHFKVSVEAGVITSLIDL